MEKFDNNKKLQSEIKRNQIKKQWRCLVPGEWTNFITSAVWSETKLKCGFNFKNHYVPGGNAGYINGKCRVFVYYRFWSIQVVHQSDMLITVINK